MIWQRAWKGNYLGIIQQKKLQIITTCLAITSWSPYSLFCFNNVYRSEMVKLSRKEKQNLFFSVKLLSFYFEGRKQCFPHSLTAEDLMQISNQSTASLTFFPLALLAKADGKCSLTKTQSALTLLLSVRAGKWLTASAESLRSIRSMWTGKLRSKCHLTGNILM